MQFPRTVAAAGLSILLLAGSGAGAQTQNELQTMRIFLEIMTEYFEIIESTHSVAADHEKAAILQMQKIQEIYEDRGEKARAASVLMDVIETSENDTIRNAAYILLGDTLKETGRSDEAIEYLRRGLKENIEAARPPR